MISPIASILRSCTRQDKKYRVLTSETHEGFETSLAKTNCEFHAFFTEGLKRWRHDFRKLPDNYHVYRDNFIPDVEFDCCLIQSKFGQFQALYPIAKQLHLPIICLEHTDVMPWWSQEDISNLKAMKGDLNVFITNYSKKTWQCEEEEYIVVNHGVDTDIFYPKNLKRENRVLSVVNDFINRGNILGYPMWERVTANLARLHVGDSPGLSRAASSQEELANIYRQSKIFINTSLKSPLPKSLLEAMACGCAVVTTDNCEMSSIIKNGENGFKTNDEKEMRKFIELLMEDESLATKLGSGAVETIRRDFSEDKFVENWNNIFEIASNTVFRG